MAQVQDTVMQECSWQAPPAGSVAHDMFGWAAERGTRALVMDAFIAVEFTSPSASDHLRAMNTVIVHPDPRRALWSRDADRHR